MKKLRKTREMLGLTQFELAKAAGLTANKITFWETGRSQLTDAELERVKTRWQRARKKSRTRSRLLSCTPVRAVATRGGRKSKGRLERGYATRRVRQKQIILARC